MKSVPFELFWIFYFFLLDLVQKRRWRGGWSLMFCLPERGLGAQELWFWVCHWEDRKRVRSQRKTQNNSQERRSVESIPDESGAHRVTSETLCLFAVICTVFGLFLFFQMVANWHRVDSGFSGQLHFPVHLWLPCSSLASSHLPLGACRRTYTSQAAGPCIVEASHCPSSAKLN